MKIHNITLLAVCIFICMGAALSKEPEIQPLINECVAKGMEKQKAESLINAILLEKQISSTKASSLSNRVERAKITTQAVKAIDTFSSNKLSRAVALGLWGKDGIGIVKRAALDRLFELKDPKVTDMVIQVLEDNIHPIGGSFEGGNEALAFELVKLLNVLTGSNYKLDIYNDSEIRRKEIVKAAKEKLAKQKEMESKGMTSDNPTNILLRKEGHMSGTNF